MNPQSDNFPFKRVLTLRYLAEFWQKVATNPGNPLAKFASDLYEEIKLVPELVASIDDRTCLEENADLVRRMLSAVFPADQTDVRCAIGKPFGNDLLLSTPGFDELRIFDHWYTNIMVAGRPLPPEVIDCGKAMTAYHHILRSFYDTDAHYVYPTTYCFTDPASHLTRYFDLKFDPRYAEFVCTRELPPLEADVLDLLTANPMDLELWQRHLPPEHFEIHGIVVLKAVEVTATEILSILKNELLLSGSLTNRASLDRIQGHLQDLLGKPELDVGLVGFGRISGGSMNTAHAVGRSLAVSDGITLKGQSVENSIYSDAFRSEHGVATNLATKKYDTDLERHLRSAGYRSLIVAPLHHGGETIGLLEIGSKTERSLTSFDLVRLAEAVELLATALHRSLDAYSDRVQAVIKSHFTGIHPAVEWRFEQAAVNYLNAQSRGATDIKMEPIVFREVYPMYGLSDIRNSSITRSNAIRDDLIEQLGLALSVIVEASAQNPLPVLDELGFRIDKFVSELELELRTDQEVEAVAFLRDSVEPMFANLSHFGPSVQDSVREYREQLDPEYGIVAKRRKQYQQSVQIINDAIAHFLTAKQAYAQEMFPHYFEQYKSDGVDYNIYVGGSLVHDRDFDELFLQNLRIWQLLTLCGIVWELERIKPTLPVALQTAHLILAQDFPITIRFRQDERKFDVDGAYNARYEIVKKRIDKAVIKGTNERLTQPGSISIVFSQPKEGEDYERFLDYLTAAGYVQPGIEEFTLDDQPGAIGLKALRVKVAAKPPDMETRTSPAGLFQDEHAPGEDKLREDEGATTL